MTPSERKKLVEEARKRGHMLQRWGAHSHGDFMLSLASLIESDGMAVDKLPKKKFPVDHSGSA